jgi:hypothetical protein
LTTPDFNDDFRDLLDGFRAAGVEHLIVGAHALAAHNLPRATGDLDVFVRPSVDNAARVYRALAAFGAPLDAHGVTAADFAAEETVYQIGLPPRRIDVITSISGVTFDEAWAGHVVVEVHGMPLPVLGRAELIRNKRASARPKDLADLAALERE